MKVFGELEYLFGTLKLTFITMLIVMMLVLDTMKREYYPVTNFNQGSNKGDIQREQMPIILNRLELSVRGLTPHFDISLQR